MIAPTLEMKTPNKPASKSAKPSMRWSWDTASFELSVNDSWSLPTRSQEGKEDIETYQTVGCSSRLIGKWRSCHSRCWSLQWWFQWPHIGWRETGRPRKRSGLSCRCWEEWVACGCDSSFPPWFGSLTSSWICSTCTLDRRRQMRFSTADTWRSPSRSRSSTELLGDCDSLNERVSTWIEIWQLTDDMIYMMIYMINETYSSRARQRRHQVFAEDRVLESEESLAPCDTGWESPWRLRWVLARSQHNWPTDIPSQGPLEQPTKNKNEESKENRRWKWRVTSGRTRWTSWAINPMTWFAPDSLSSWSFHWYVFPCRAVTFWMALTRSVTLALSLISLNCMKALALTVPLTSRLPAIVVTSELDSVLTIGETSEDGRILAWRSRGIWDWRWGGSIIPRRLWSWICWLRRVFWRGSELRG